MKLLFMGTGDIALPSFKALIESSHEVIGLVTQPDKPVGRKQILTAPEIKNVAVKNGIPVYQPEKARNKKFIDEVEALAPDLIIVMAYGQILTSRLIAAPKVAIINAHASLLPLYRGASCIQGPIADGYDKTGLTIMHVVKELDAGDMILQVETPISSGDTGGIVHDRLAEMSPAALLEVVEQFQKGTTTRTPQIDSESTYAPKLLRNDGELQFSKGAQELELLIRAYHPWPGTFLNFSDRKGKSKRLKVFPPVTVIKESNLTEGELKESDGDLLVGCANGTALKLDQIQPEGSKRMSSDQFLKGSPLV